MKSPILRSAIIILLVIIIPKVGFSQTTNSVIASDITTSCELLSALFDSFIQGTATDKTIIIISYKGKNESKNNISERRLHNAKTHFTEFYKNSSYSRSADKIITAYGTNNPKEGKLEFYVEGQLMLVMLFRNNRDLNLSPCVTDSRNICEDKIKKLYYPCIQNNNKKSRR